jgi:putative heme-binding domain-containing protein
MASQHGARAADEAQQGDDAATDFLTAVGWLPSPEDRSARRADVLAYTRSGHAAAVRRLALRVLAMIPASLEESYRLAASLIDEPEVRDAAFAAMLDIPQPRRDASLAEGLVLRLIADAEKTPAEERTQPAYLDRMQLADQLLGQLPVEQSRALRDRMRDIAVRVVRLKTIPEEMRYDTPYFAVEAGRQVQVVLQNDDLMPHNLVVTRPGAMREVGEQGSAVNNPADGLNGLQYVPRNDNVLFAMPMTPAQSVQRLTFQAPDTPGEYPYVCTFPRHWMRMYGVMVVVEDLDAWLQDPVKPKDPLGNTREVVQAWKPADFTVAGVESGIRGRSLEIGQRLFAEATCAQCHKVAGQGGAVGPELNDVLKRYQGDRWAVLREILEPAHKIEPKYIVRVIQTADGLTRSGIVVAEDKDSITVVDNPERPDPVRIARDDIEEMVQSSLSLMPKGLLDRFTEDEILEILNYITSEHAPSDH